MFVYFFLTMTAMIMMIKSRSAAASDPNSAA